MNPLLDYLCSLDDMLHCNEVVKSHSIRKKGFLKEHKTLHDIIKSYPVTVTMVHTGKFSYNSRSFCKTYLQFSKTI